MTWWQWTLIGVGAWLTIGIPTGIAVARYEAVNYWKRGVKADVGFEAIMSTLFWPIVLLITIGWGFRWVGNQLQPLAKSIYIPAQVRKDPGAHVRVVESARW